MRRVFDTFIGLYELLRMSARSGFAMNNPYWRWRRETAFGTDPALKPSRAARIRAILQYAAWAHRMRRRYGM